MRISLVVVNQNLAALKQAVNSLIIACKNIDYELFIVDNNSTSATLETLAADFPHAQIIANASASGICKANNQALEMATGEYILIVSADTICFKDSIEKMAAFMDAPPNTGGLSVRMLSPQGRFLPESIHGLTKSWAAFFKLIGFAKNLSKTRLYDRNRKDWVEEFQITEVDVLNSACMMLRRSVLNTVGLFDERFVGYGYDIDLTYRIRLAGFKNYYFPKTYFIKSEGDSAPKFTWEYIKNFYGAMLLFAVKYSLKVPEIKVNSIAPQLSAAVE